MSTVRAILEQKRLPLLDVSSRSALLNYASNPTFGLELINVKPHRVYQGLVLEGEQFTFLSISQQIEASESMKTAHERDAHKPQLQTPYAVAPLQKRLVQTLHRAHAVIDDFGEPLLFLTLGKLRWVNPENPDDAWHAPLILIPVTLNRRDVRSPFSIQVSGEDPQVNETLKALLKTQFQIELPAFDAFHPLGLKQFLEGTSAAIEGRQGWHVGRQLAHVDFFKLSDFAFYRDLDPNTGYVGGAEEVDLLHKTLTDGFADDEAQPIEPASIDILAEPNQLDHVLDANNEQLLIVLDTLRGVNQVVEGPPGSGKTQTIANIVSAVLGAEKSVLVVSNKVRSLKDVASRLRQVGLRHLALPLYGKHLGRAEVLREIQTVLSAQDVEMVDETVHIESLKRLRDQLNVYSKSLHMPIRESGVTPYEAYNELVDINAQLQGIARPEFDGKVLAGWTASRFEAVLQSTKELETHFARIGVPQRHPFWGSKKAIFQAADRPEVQRKCRLAGLALNALRVSSTELAHQMGAPAPNHSEDVIRLVRAASKAIEAPNVRGINVHEGKWGSSMEELVSLIETGSKLKKVRQAHEETLIPEAWGQEVLAIRQAFVAHGNKKTRKLIKEYRQARDSFAGLCRNGLPESNAEQLEAVNAILESQRLQAKLEQHEALAETLFGRQWKGIESDWEHLDNVSGWLYELHQEIAQAQVSADILHFLGSNLELSEVHEMAQKTAKEFNTFLQTSRDAAREVAMEDALGITKRAFGRVPFGTLLSLFAHWEKNIDSLQDIVAFNHLAQRLREDGLGDIVHLAVTWSESSKYLTARVREARYTALLTDALNTRRTLAGFDGEVQNQVIEKYGELDQEHLMIMARRIHQVQKQRFMRERLPAGNVHSMLHELAEAPVRTLDSLFSEAGQSLVDIKPVFLMTPASVASVLSDSSVQFDLIIIDEAGRMNTVEALGSLARGAQVIAFGDSHQGMPPRFTQSNPMHDEEAAFERESILDALRQQGAASKELRWIYPRKPAPLMNWVNQHVYEGRLHILPHANAPAARNMLGIHEVSEHANAAGNGPVRSFIGTVIEAVLKHAEHLPGKSIGVVVQDEDEAIPLLRELERRRQRDPAFEAFFKAHTREPFFVKTLETAQGDLRDVIFFALAFKKQGYADRKLAPAMKNDEEVRHRLAALSSLARRECHVFTDCSLEDINRMAGDGHMSNVLNHFLQHIRRIDAEVEHPVVASKFELVIADALRKEGYRVAHAVGSNGYRVNLAVLDDRKRGAYTLGILCDGEQYASTFSARERDRLIPAMLMAQGWNLHRVWSVEWHRNPERELSRLLDRLKAVSSQNEKRSGNTVNITSNGSYRSMKDA